jgi:uncharacterized protein YutE (UPF0331/DUF86 family)
LSKNQALFPLALESLELITDSQEESIDALILRYSQCVTMIQDQIFKGIAFLEQEDISDKSNRDKALLMEKLGAIRSAEEFGTAALLRNKFAHHYPEVSRARLERLNLLPIEAALVIETFDAIEKFLKNKQFL